MFESISTQDLDRVAGGASRAAVCNRAQFDWMAAHMVPDSSRQPGVARHVVAADARTCGFPMPR
jgi:hypothetical protein